MELKLDKMYGKSTWERNFNRTRWNWNRVTKFVRWYFLFILIVPDGIETFQKYPKRQDDHKILIVPDGIETVIRPLLFF